VSSILLNPEVRPVWTVGTAAELLAAYERVWERKTILRRLYESWYELIARELRPGPVLEIGAGTGNFKRWMDRQGRTCWTLDIIRGRFVDVQADALKLPLREASVENVVLIDALHHFSRPTAFIRAAAGCLRAGGRLILLEPYVSWWGWFVYKYLHHEGVDFSFVESDSAKAAWDGNAAIPRLVLETAGVGSLPLRLVKSSHCEFLSYPLSGGFSYRSLLPESALLALHRLEQSRLFRNRLLSLRVFAVLEKSA